MYVMHLKHQLFNYLMIDPSILYKELRTSLEGGRFRQKFEIIVKGQNRADVGSEKGRGGS